MSIVTNEMVEKADSAFWNNGIMREAVETIAPDIIEVCARKADKEAERLRSKHQPKQSEANAVVRVAAAIRSLKEPT